MFGDEMNAVKISNTETKACVQGSSFHLKQGDCGMPEILKPLITLKRELLFEEYNWKTLYSFINQLNFEEEPRDCILFLIELVKFLTKYKYRYTCGILEILKILFEATQRDNIVGTSIFVKSMESKLCSLRKIHAQKQYIKCHYQGDDNRHTDYVWRTAARASTGLLKLMLKFGMGMLAPGETSIRRWWEYLEQLKLNNIDLERHEEDYVRKRLASTEIPIQRKRISFVMKALDIVGRMTMAQEFVEDYIICYRLVFDSTSEPLVSSAEVESFLEYTLPLRYHDAVSEIVEKMEGLLPDVPEVPEPRTLQHLCRVQIRHSLCQNFNLPYGVASLILPDSLKQYLLLEDDGDYSNITMTAPYCNFIQLPKAIVLYPEKNLVLEYIRHQ